MIATRKALLPKLAGPPAMPPGPPRRREGGVGGDRYSDGLPPATAKLPLGYPRGRRRRGCRSRSLARSVLSRLEAARIADPRRFGPAVAQVGRWRSLLAAKQVVNVVSEFSTYE